MLWRSTAYRTIEVSIVLFSLSFIVWLGIELQFTFFLLEVFETESVASSTFSACSVKYGEDYDCPSYKIWSSVP